MGSLTGSNCRDSANRQTTSRITIRTVAWSNASWASASVSRRSDPDDISAANRSDLVRWAVDTSSSSSSTACRTFSRSTLERSACRLRDSSTASSRPDTPLLDRLERLGRKKLPQAVEFLGAFAVIEPAVALPFAPGLEINARIDQPELAAVGQQAQPMAGAPEQFQEPGVGVSPSATANVRRRIGHDQQRDGVVPMASAKTTRCGRMVSVRLPIRTGAVRLCEG